MGKPYFVQQEAGNSLLVPKHPGLQYIAQRIASEVHSLQCSCASQHVKQDGPHSTWNLQYGSLCSMVAGHERKSFACIRIPIGLKCLTSAEMLRSHSLHGDSSLLKFETNLSTIESPHACCEAVGLQTRHAEQPTCHT